MINQIMHNVRIYKIICVQYKRLSLFHLNVCMVLLAIHVLTLTI